MPIFQHSNSKVIPITFAVLFLSGCTVASNPKETAESLNGALSVFKNASSMQSTFIPQKWWEIYDDEALKALIETALVGNPSLQIYAARLEAARAVMRQASAARFPTLDIYTTTDYARTSPTTKEGIARGGTALRDPTYQAGTSVAWEADLWGRIDNSVKSASEEVSIALADREAIKLSISTEVAIAYWQLRAAEADFAMMQSAHQFRLEAEKLMTSRYRGGFVSELDVTRVRVERINAETAMEEANRRRIITEQAIAELLGHPIVGFSVPRSQMHSDVLPTSPEIEPGVPANMLVRRPDLAASTHNILRHASNISVAEADFYPSIRLVGNFGVASSSLSRLLQRNSRQLSLGPLEITLPIFDGGLRHAQLAQANAQYDEAIATHKLLLLKAMREVDDALVNIQSWQKQTSSNEEALLAAKRAEHIALSRYKRGLTSYLEVIDAQQAAVTAERGLIQSKAQLLYSNVLLVKSLGGGWHEKNNAG
ncbi:efflux transporter outer membrane subunit [Serratia sp. 2723]|uniref:efflux transporter outer membrane subunit n=1 Tax=unclassified Serratia (in: enterobacteria) TaxID=2647522 RepID=UPI003D259E62